MKRGRRCAAVISEGATDEDLATVCARPAARVFKNAEQESSLCRAHAAIFEAGGDLRILLSLRTAAGAWEPWR